MGDPRLRTAVTGLAVAAAIWTTAFAPLPAQQPPQTTATPPPQRVPPPSQIPPPPPWTTQPAGASPVPQSPTMPPPNRPPDGLPAERRLQVTLTDVTPQSRIVFRHVNGATGEHFYPEQMGSGAAFLDYDGDGLLDIFLVQGGPLPGFKDQGPPGNLLYRNNGNGSFTDMTRQAGLTDTRYGFGVAVADYDNDGYPDLFVTNLMGDALYHNDGHGRFVDVTVQA